LAIGSSAPVLVNWGELAFMLTRTKSLGKRQQETFHRRQGTTTRPVHNRNADGEDAADWLASAQSQQAREVIDRGGMISSSLHDSAKYNRNLAGLEPTGRDPPGEIGRCADAAAVQ
jgi:hypothetical protein